MLDRPAWQPGEDWRAACRALGDPPSLLLAVSGGPDSLAMLAGFAALARAGVALPPFGVATVDHGLRPEGAEEARAVGVLCDELGLAHTVLTLPACPGSSNVQAWARAQRYRALGALAGAGVVVTAHTADDQAETFLMRAARGTGADGLAGIGDQASVHGARLARPFLSWPRAQLHAALAFLDARQTARLPVHDPSNMDARYTRVRFRQWLAQAPQPDGARAIVQGLSASARIAALERDALETLAARWFAALGAEGRDAGYVRAQVGLAEQPPALSARLLRRILQHVARHDDGHRFDLARIMDLVVRMQAQPHGTFVLGGARLDWRCAGGLHRLLAFAEAGRAGFAQLTVAPGDTSLWDGRFLVRNATRQPVIVRAWRRGDEDGRDDLPARVRASLPVVHEAGDGAGVRGGALEGATLTFLPADARGEPGEATF